MLLGWLQFFGTYAMNLKIEGGTAWVLAASAAAAYFATEVGIYYTMMVPVAAVDGIPDGDNRLSQLFTFPEYIALALESTSYEGTQSGNFEFGGIATKLTYAVDILACFGTAFVTRMTIAAGYPFCNQCNLYKKRDTKFEAKMQAGDNAEKSFNTLLELIANRNYQQITSYLREISGMSVKDGDVMITADQRFCVSCKEATIDGRVFTKDGREWAEVNDMAFQFDSRPGEHLAI